MEFNILQIGIFVFVMASVTIAIPTRFNDIQNDELTRLSKLIAKMSRLRETKNDNTFTQNGNQVKPDSQQRENYGLLLSLNEPIKIEEFPNKNFLKTDKSVSEKSNSAAVEKRQGVWDYDYGLGGGRFGKRGFGDYALGGGRFGRDVDHVDSNEPIDFPEE